MPAWEDIHKYPPSLRTSAVEGRHMEWSLLVEPGLHTYSVVGDNPALGQDRGPGNNPAGASDAADSDDSVVAECSSGEAGFELSQRQAEVLVLLQRFGSSLFWCATQPPLAEQCQSGNRTCRTSPMQTQYLTVAECGACFLPHESRLAWSIQL